MKELGPRISRGALARMTGATALGLAVAPQVAAAGDGVRRRHLHRSSVLTDGRAGDVGMDADALEDAFARVARRVTDGRFPGAVALVARRGIVVGERAFGVRLAGSTEATTTDTLYDVESMTKVLATATAAMLLVQRGKLSLTDPVAKYLPHFAANGKEDVLVRDLLRYSSGLPIDNQKVDTDDIDAIWRFMEETPLEYPTGSMVEYSDLGYRLLGRLIETVAKKDLDTLREARDLGPAGHGATRPSTPLRRSCRAAPPPARARSACAPVRCAARCRTTRTGRSAASSAATARSPRPATSRSSAR